MKIEIRDFDLLLFEAENDYDHKIITEAKNKIKAEFIGGVNKECTRLVIPLTKKEIDDEL